MSPSFIAFLDSIFPTLMCLALGVGVIMLVGLSVLHTKAQQTGTSQKLPKLGFIFLFILTTLSALATSATLQHQGKAEVLAYLGGVDARHVEITVAGKPLSHRKEIKALLEALQPAAIRAHHSHNINRFEVVLNDKKQGELVLWIARDSQVPEEYWVYYPRYKTTQSNEIYKLRTAVFDGD